MSGLRPLIPHQRAIGGVGVGFAGGRVVSLDQRAPMRALFPVPEPGDPPLAALVNTAGGLVGGDAVTQKIEIGDGAATVTTAAAEKVYRSLGPEAQVETRLAIGPGALLEWLPQETILFDGARLDRRLTIALVPGARLLAAEMLVFGRAARAETFRRGLLRDRWHVVCEGRSLWIDALVLDAELQDRFRSPFALAGAQALGTLLVACAEPARVVADLREGDPSATATVPRPGLALVRWLGGAGAVRASVAAAIRAVRARAFGLAPRLPRLWAC